MELLLHARRRRAPQEGARMRGGRSRLWDVTGETHVIHTGAGAGGGYGHLQDLGDIVRAAGEGHAPVKLAAVSAAVVQASLARVAAAPAAGVARPAAGGEISSGWAAAQKQKERNGSSPYRGAHRS